MEANPRPGVETNQCRRPDPTGCPSPARPGAEPGRNQAGPRPANVTGSRPTPRTEPPNLPASPRRAGPGGRAGRPIARTSVVLCRPRRGRWSAPRRSRRLLYHNSPPLSHPRGPVMATAPPLLPIRCQDQKRGEGWRPSPAPAGSTVLITACRPAAHPVRRPPRPWPLPAAALARSAAWPGGNSVCQSGCGSRPPAPHWSAG